MESKSLTAWQGAGIGVAVGFVGALLLVAVALFAARHRYFPTKPSPTGSGLKKKKDWEGKEPEPALDASIVITGNAVAQAVDFPLQSAPIEKDTKDLSARIIPLNSVEEGVRFHRHIDNLVDNFIRGMYDASPMPSIPDSTFDEDQLVRLAGEPVNGGTWSESISSLETRPRAIKCFLAQLLFRRMDPHCPVDENLLPPEIAACYQLLSGKDGLTQVGEDTLAVWRETVYLLRRSAYNLLPAPPLCFHHGDPRRERIHAMIPDILEATKLESMRVDYTREGLEVAVKNIFEVAANAAMVLLGQPSAWEALWASEKPGFMVFPEIRLIWDGKVKDSRPAEIEPRAAPSPMAGGADGGHPESVAAEEGL
ncbi:hypothetical protein ACJ41O_009965 [Fusarium nematophilum]